MPTLEDALRQQVVLFEKNNRAFHAKQTKASSVAQELFGTKQISSKRRKQAQKFILKAYDELDPVPFALCTCLAITTQSDYATKLDPLSLNEWTRSQQISTELSLSATQIYRNFRASALAAPKSPDDEGGADARSSAATFRKSSRCLPGVQLSLRRSGYIELRTRHRRSFPTRCLGD
ncbi:hypothetical protein IQ07DRAFT_583518 [Pyrenochaeta sp. DS3sAY3a]|nr:hypothetical protein IQ07DRAFT_583518 [Pyrenochaeta sp. DS3sAY3a]